jgi:hypothetical protein
MKKQSEKQMRLPAVRPNSISDIMDWYSEFQTKTGDAVWIIWMPKQIHSRVRKLLQGMLVDRDWLYGAMLSKDSSLKDEIEIVGWEKYDNTPS